MTNLKILTMFIVKFDKVYIAKTRKSPLGPTPFLGFLQFVPGVGEPGGTEPVLSQPHHPCLPEGENNACAKFGGSNKV